MVGLFSEVEGQISFRPRKRGDVGHDLEAVVDSDDLTWFDRIVSWFRGRPTMVVLPLIGVRVIRSGKFLVMPGEVWCEIRSRSSTSRKKLQVLGGTIDSGYHGELYTVIHNLGLVPRFIAGGERYAQVVFFYAMRPQISDLTGPQFECFLTESEMTGGRGQTGFGSTGA